MTFSNIFSIKGIIKANRNNIKKINIFGSIKKIFDVSLGFMYIFILVPTLGSKKLLDHFETEMNILHKLSKDDIEAVVGEKVANSIVNAREGNVHIHAGGGGVYGKIENK